MRLKSVNLDPTVISGGPAQGTVWRIGIMMPKRMVAFGVEAAMFA